MGTQPYWENKILDLLFGKQAYTPPSTLYLGLCTSVTGGVVTGEPTIGTNGYARVAIVNSDISTTWGAASGGVKLNANSTVVFPAPVGSAWGTFPMFFFSDAATAGDILLSGTLAPPVVTAVGIPPTFGLNQLQVTVS